MDRISIPKKILSSQGNTEDKVKLLKQLKKVLGDLYGPNTGNPEDQRKGYDQKGSLETNYGEFGDLA